MIASSFRALPFWRQALLPHECYESISRRQQKMDGERDIYSHIIYNGYIYIHINRYAYRKDKTLSHTHTCDQHEYIYNNVNLLQGLNLTICAKNTCSYM